MDNKLIKHCFDVVSDLAIKCKVEISVANEEYSKEVSNLYAVLLNSIANFVIDNNIKHK